MAEYVAEGVNRLYKAKITYKDVMKYIHSSLEAAKKSFLDQGSQIIDTSYIETAFSYQNGLVNISLQRASKVQ